jgi:hypothetical protein
MYISVMKDVRHVLKLWPSLQDVADDASVGIEAVKQWPKRGYIPSGRWSLLAKGAKQRGIKGITVEFLASKFSQDQSTT